MVVTRRSNAAGAVDTAQSSNETTDGGNDTNTTEILQGSDAPTPSDEGVVETGKQSSGSMVDTIAKYSEPSTAVTTDGANDVITTEILQGSDAPVPSDEAVAETDKQSSGSIVDTTAKCSESPSAVEADESHGPTEAVPKPKKNSKTNTRHSIAETNEEPSISSAEAAVGSDEAVPKPKKNPKSNTQHPVIDVNGDPSISSIEAAAEAGELHGVSSKAVADDEHNDEPSISSVGVTTEDSNVHETVVNEKIGRRSKISTKKTSKSTKDTNWNNVDEVTEDTEVGMDSQPRNHQTGKKFKKKNPKKSESVNHMDQGGNDVIMEDAEVSGVIKVCLFSYCTGIYYIFLHLIHLH